MTIFKCKMCGGTLEFQPGDTVAVCDSCSTKQTLPRLDDERRANLYDRANHFRRSNEYDKAMGIYEQILNEDNTDAEAYWSLVLCRYGIEYVEDPATHKRVPTVNRAQFTSVFDDDNYKAALRYADAAQREIYESEARAINEIQKGILAISQKEAPFDVFICYKESDANGRRTQDSVLANDLYHQLTQEGFKVFFSRITLEDKLGTAYEPYIFAALHSARVMVVLGTRPEYFNAVWVKNEWSRYLAIVKQSGGKKALIPAYRDMDPYDLPEEFSHLQAQDMSKLGFMQDLIRGIRKIVSAEAPNGTEKETVVVNAGGGAVAPLLERAFLFLEDEKWQDANTYCEKVLDIDPKNAEAYLGKLMAELGVKKREQLSDCPEPFDDRDNYNKVVRFGDETLQAELKGYIDHIDKRNENERITEIYNSAIAVMQSADTSEKYKAAAEKFQQIPGFQDADALAEKCLEQAEIARLEAEKKAEEKRQEAERKAEERRKAVKKIKKTLKIGVPVLAACVAFVIVLTSVIIPTSKYNAAMKLYDAKKYDEALAAFEELKGYKDSKTQVSNCKYMEAVELYEDKQYDKAIAAFQALNGYKDSETKLENCCVGKFGKEKWNTYKNFKVGDSYTFGAYEQDNDQENGKEAIEWIVLDKDTNDGLSLLLVSKQALDCQPYNSSYTDVTWESCSLRKWLNDTFLNEAFTSAEQEKIQNTKVSADKNPGYSTDPGKDTTDKVFLLSIPEAEQYFSTDEARKCVPTAYAIAQGAYTSDRYTSGGKATCLWWLRSPGCAQIRAADVVGGVVFCYGDSVRADSVCVRPALWIDLAA